MVNKNPNITKDEITNYVKESYKAVYKVKKYEPLTEQNAEIYLNK